MHVLCIQKPQLKLFFPLCRLQKTGLNIIHNLKHIKHHTKSIIESHFQISPNLNCFSNFTPHLHHSYMYYVCVSVSMCVPICLCVFMWAYLYMCVYVCLCVGLSLCACAYVCVHVSSYVSVYVCVGQCVYVCLCVCVHHCVCFYVSLIIKSTHLCIYEGLLGSLNVLVIPYHYTSTCESYLYELHMCANLFVFIKLFNPCLQFLVSLYFLIYIITTHILITKL
jgi:hypothetical protein